MKGRVALVVMLLAYAAFAAASSDSWTQLDEQARAQYLSGDYADAEVSAQQALTSAEPDAQSRHELSLEARRAEELNEQALLLHAHGDYQQAAALYEQALPLIEKHFGPDSVEAARVLASLADTCEQRKDHARAKILYQRALDVYDRHADETIAQANVLNALASVYYIQRQFGKSEPLFKRSLQLMESTLGAQHVDLLPVLDNLAALYLTTRRNDRADEFQRRAATIRKKFDRH